MCSMSEVGLACASKHAFVLPECVQGVFRVGEQVKCLVMGLDPGYTNISLSVAGESNIAALWFASCCVQSCINMLCFLKKLATYSLCRALALVLVLESTSPASCNASCKLPTEGIRRRVRSRCLVALPSIAELELEEGDILDNKQRVWDNAEEQAAVFREHLDKLRDEGFDFEKEYELQAAGGAHS